MQAKKWISVLLTVALLLTLLPLGAMAAPVEYGTITGIEEGQMEYSLAAAAISSGGPALAPGNHQLWIDRIDQLPEYAYSLYHWLKTNSTGTGALLDPTRGQAVKGSSGKYDTYVHPFHTITGTADFTYTGSAYKDAAVDAMWADLGDKHTIAIQYATAAYGAFDRDHPEVFWLSGRSLYGYSVSYSYSHSDATKTGDVSYSVELSFYLQSPDFDIRSEDYQSTRAITAAIAEQSAAVAEIIGQCPQGSAYEQVRYLNRVLTEINAYNSAVATGNDGDASKTAWESISALTGNAGTEGPVCEGYSKALMVLCQELDIPCVLSEGDAKSSPTGSPGGHMWNYIQLGNAWYAVDTTWNDPFISWDETNVCSGYENENWLLVGSDTVISGMPFSTSHVLTNRTTINSLTYINGPALAKDAYVPEPEPTVVKPTLALKVPTLEFKDMITVNVMFTAENIDDVVEMGMLTYTEKVDTWSVETANHVIPGTTYDVNTGRYIAHSQGIHAKYLGDSVYMTVYAKLTDGSYVYCDKIAPYSPVQYATNQLNKSTDMKLKQLCAAMLNYGAEAQLFFGHNVDALANASLTAEQKALPETYNVEMTGSVPAATLQKQGAFANNKGFAKRTPSISFEGAFCINYFFTPAYAPVDGITMYYWTAADFEANEVLTIENASGSFQMEGEGVGQYRGDITDIAAKALSEAVYVAAIYSDGTTTWTSGVLGYSIGSYCASQISKGADVAGLAEATAVYGYHAKQFFGL